jgi:hypothetical protein
MNTQNLIWGLEELSDRNFQERVWLGKSVTEMSSFVEAICHTFDDSGLADTLDSERKRSEMSPDLREIALKLDRLVKKVPQGLTPLDIINHPAMKEVREIAEEMLMMLKT